MCSKLSQSPSKQGWDEEDFNKNAVSTEPTQLVNLELFCHTILTHIRKMKSIMERSNMRSISGVSK